MGNGSSQPQNEAESDPVIESVGPSKTSGETTKLLPTNSQPQNLPRPSSLPNSASERSAPETKTGYGGLSTIPRKRKADVLGSITLSDENRLPPKRRRKQDSCLSQPQAIPINNSSDDCSQIRCRSQSPIPPNPTSLEPMEVDGHGNDSCRLNNKLENPGRTKICSSFDQRPIDSMFFLVQLESLLQQCREVSEQASAHRGQEELRRQNMELKHRAEIGRMQKRLDKMQSAWVRETNALNKVKGEIEKVKEKLRQEEQISSDLRRQAESSELLDLARQWENARATFRQTVLEEERKVQAAALDKIRQELASAQSTIDAVEEKRRFGVEASREALQELVHVRAACNAIERKRRHEEISATQKIACLETQLADAESRAGARLEEISELETRAVDAENRLNTQSWHIFSLEDEERKRVKNIDERLHCIPALETRIKLAESNLLSERQHILGLEHKLKRAQRKVVRLHFSANILSSYFLVMLKDQKIWRSSLEEKEDDIHDLWDVQNALQRALEGYSSYLETIPNRSDYYGGVGCPLCGPTESSMVDTSTKIAPSTSRKVKNPPVEIGSPTRRRIEEKIETIARTRVSTAKYNWILGSPSEAELNGNNHEAANGPHL